ncbi:MAG: response regulator [Candidatus Omnitrophica bacterium]|nr:response regulator [Candidatus Omnitrophota bacterium]MDD5671265.1 response regulator [Candidatus Omnitrophota bacterium]
MGYRILIVDDEPDVVKLTTLRLERSGYDISIATDGDMAVLVAKQVVPDLILLDIRLPKLNGYEVFRRIREDPQLAKIPIIFATADDSGEVPENVQRLGAEGYLIKPFETAVLVKKIKQFLP